MLGAVRLERNQMELKDRKEAVLFQGFKIAIAYYPWEVDYDDHLILPMD